MGRLDSRRSAAPKGSADAPEAPRAEEAARADGAEGCGPASPLADPKDGHPEGLRRRRGPLASPAEGGPHRGAQAAACTPAADFEKASGRHCSPLAGSRSAAGRGGEAGSNP